MEENKVILSLEKYVEMYDKIKELENQLSQLGSLILNYTELNDKKVDLRIDGYEIWKNFGHYKRNFPKRI